MDNLTKEQRHKNMQNIRSIGTIPERLVMRELRRRRIYFTKYDKSLTGKPDIVFKRKKIAVFIDSDFWHGNLRRYIKPQTNIDYWNQKISQNREHDKQVNRKLKSEGWKIIRLWEYDIKHHFEKSIQNILDAIKWK